MQKSNNGTRNKWLFGTGKKKNIITSLNRLGLYTLTGCFLMTLMASPPRMALDCAGVKATPSLAQADLSEVNADMAQLYCVVVQMAELAPQAAQAD